MAVGAKRRGIALGLLLGLGLSGDAAAAVLTVVERPSSAAACVPQNILGCP